MLTDDDERHFFWLTCPCLEVPRRAARSQGAIRSRTSNRLAPAVLVEPEWPQAAVACRRHRDGARTCRSRPSMPRWRGCASEWGAVVVSD